MDLDSLPRYPGGPLKIYPDGYIETEYEALMDWATETASPPAVEEALIAASPDDSVLSLEIPQEFGQKWASELSLCRIGLLEHDKQTRLDLLLVAARLVEYRRLYNGLYAWLKGRECPYRCAREYRIQEPETYHIDTWRAPLELLIGTSFKNFPGHDIFRVQALAWFFEAADLHRKGDPKAFDLLFEVKKALQIAGGAILWSDAEGDEGTLAVRSMSQKGTDALHAFNRNRAKQIRDWWLANRVSFTSLDQAAERASKEFSCAFRTARDHIGMANKELRSAGKA